LPVACHALGDRDAAAAAAAGCDVLAHTPVEPLAGTTIDAWRGKTVISTLMAFGGGDDAVDNLRRLHDAGVTVLYGTDLGNRRVAGVDDDELRLLGDAGLDDDEIRASMTTAPIAFWKLER
jgi:imidazolonepropionase-like amidohydrolase